MGISNEIYVVHTADKGDVVVGLGEYVTYGNITLVGYNAYNYHSYISQSLVNLKDAITLLQGGPAAQAASQLDVIVAAAKADIQKEKDAINDAIVTLISDGLTETISITQLQNTHIETHLASVTTKADKSIVDIEEIDIRVTSIEHELEDPITKLGIRKTLLTHLASITDLTSKIGEVSSRDANNNIKAGSGILEDVSTLKTQVNIIPTHTSSIKTIQDIIGTSYNNSTTTLSQDTISIKNILFKNGDVPIDYTGEGIYNEIYNSSTGIKVRLNDIDSILTTINSLSSSQSNASATLTVAITNIDRLDTSYTTLQTIVGADLTTGLQKKVKDLESIGISSSLTNITTNLTTLNNTIGDTSKGLVKQANKSTSDITTIISNHNSLKTTVESHTTSITGINSNLSTLNTFVDNFHASLDTYYTVGGIVYNATKFKSMNDNLTTLNTNDRSSQFDSYFIKSGSTYKTDIEFCQPGIQFWVNSSANNGMKVLTKGHISDYLTNDVKYNTISTLQSTLNTLTAPVTTNGSIDKRINDAFINFEQLNIDPLNTTLAAQTSSINTLTTSATTTNTRLLSIENSLPSINTKINEMDKESVKYSVLLPFMKKMILMAKDTTVTNDTIVSTFDTIINNLAKLSTSYTNNGTVALTTSTGTLNFLVTMSGLSTLNYINYINITEYYIRLRYYDGTDNYILPLACTINGNVISGNVVLVDQEFYKVDKSTTDELLTTFITPKQTLTISQVIADKFGKPDALLTLDTIISPADTLDGYESFSVTIL